jgi:hypothetical protein
VPNLLLLDGCTFFLSEQNGDVESHAPEGFFYGDVRHLSQWRVLIDGEPLKTLTSRAVDYFSGRVVAAPEGKDPPLTVERNRFVTDGAHEDIVVYNHSPEHKLLELDICFAADFADIIEAQEPGAWGDRPRRLPGRRAGEDPARASARQAREARDRPAQPVLRRARHDVAVPDRARRVRTLDR